MVRNRAEMRLWIQSVLLAAGLFASCNAMDSIPSTRGPNWAGGKFVRVGKEWVDAWINQTYGFGGESKDPAKILFYFPKAGTRFEENQDVLVSFAAENSPSAAPTMWRSRQSAWLFWQVILEVDYREIARWGADWITDDAGTVNATVSLPGLSNLPGRHLAIVSIVPGTVTISECADASISPGCPESPASSLEDHGLFDSVGFET